MFYRFLNTNVINEYVHSILRVWTTSITDLYTGQVSQMSFRVHLKELIYLSVASLILLIIVWRLNTDSSEAQQNDSRYSRLRFKFDPDIYRIKKVDTHFSF